MAKTPRVSFKKCGLFVFYSWCNQQLFFTQLVFFVLRPWKCIPIPQMLHFSPLVHHSIRKTRLVSDDAGCACSSSGSSSSLNKSTIDGEKQLHHHQRQSISSLFVAFPCRSIRVWCHQWCHLCPRRKQCWPTARRWRHRALPQRPRSSTGCSWTTTWKQTPGTPMPPWKHVTCLSQWMTQKNTSPPWRPTSPTESPPRFAIGWCHTNTIYLVSCGQEGLHSLSVLKDHSGCFACFSLTIPQSTQLISLHHCVWLLF